MKKTLILSWAIVVLSALQAFSQTKPGEGFYLVVHYVNAEVKARIDGFYRVSDDGWISLPAVKIKLAAEKDIEVLRKKLHDAIQGYCAKKNPGQPGRGANPKGYAYPVINLISEEEVKKVGDGMLVVGAVKKPGVYPLPKNFNIVGAVPAAGGDDGQAAWCWTVLRGKESFLIRLTGKGWIGDPLLKPGDVVVRPSQVKFEGSYYIFGY